MSRSSALALVLGVLCLGASLVVAVERRPSSTSSPQVRIMENLPLRFRDFAQAMSANATPDIMQEDSSASGTSRTLRLDPDAPGAFVVTGMRLYAGSAAPLDVAISTGARDVGSWEDLAADASGEIALFEDLEWEAPIIIDKGTKLVVKVSAASWTSATAVTLFGFQVDQEVADSWRQLHGEMRFFQHHLTDVARRPKTQITEPTEVTHRWLGPNTNASSFTAFTQVVKSKGVCGGRQGNPVPNPSVLPPVASPNIPTAVFGVPLQPGDELLSVVSGGASSDVIIYFMAREFGG